MEARSHRLCGHGGLIYVSFTVLPVVRGLVLSFTMSYGGIRIQIVVLHVDAPIQPLKVQRSAHVFVCPRLLIINHVTLT